MKKDKRTNDDLQRIEQHALTDIFYRGVRVMVFNGTFNNISAISWQSVLLVEKTRVPGENY
jgi:hypothetical protein